MDLSLIGPIRAPLMAFCLMNVSKGVGQDG